MGTLLVRVVQEAAKHSREGDDENEEPERAAGDEGLELRDAEEPPRGRGAPPEAGRAHAGGQCEARAAAQLSVAPSMGFPARAVIGSIQSSSTRDRRGGEHGTVVREKYRTAFRIQSRSLRCLRR